MVLRAVLAVQLLLCLAAAYTSQSVEQWLLQAAWLTSGGLFGSLAWLLLTCAAKRWLQHHAVAGATGPGHCPGGRVQPGEQRHLGVHQRSAATALVGQHAHGRHFGRWHHGLAAIAQPCTHACSSNRTAGAASSQNSAAFLFNSLNSAIALVATEPHKAEQLLHDLSDLFRATLAEPRSTDPLARGGRAGQALSGH